MLRPGGAGGALRKPPAQSDEALEAVADRDRGAPSLRRLHRGARAVAVGDTHRLSALDAGRFQRADAGAVDAGTRSSEQSAGYGPADGRHYVAAAPSQAVEGAL